MNLFDIAILALLLLWACAAAFRKKKKPGGCSGCCSCCSGCREKLSARQNCGLSLDFPPRNIYDTKVR